MQIVMGNPEYLWLLLLLPLLVLLHFTLLRHTRRKAMQFANFRALKRVTGHRIITRNYGLLAIRCLLVTCAILAAAQVVIWYAGERNTNAYVLAIDSSASMEARDFEPSRLETAKRYASLFVEDAPGMAEFGLVTFSGVTLVRQTLTDDRNAVKEKIETVRSVDAGGTDIPGAIISATNLLVGTEKGRSIVLITDGSNTLETFASDSLAAAVDYAKAHHVIVNAIGVGMRSAPIGYLPTYYNISGVYDEGSLSRIANGTGGVYFHATNAEGLWNAYASISGTTERAMLPLDLTPYLLLATLALLLLEWLLANTRYRPIP